MDLKYFYNIARGRMKYGCDLNSFEMLKTGDFIKSESKEFRLNLIVTSINAKTTYGGGATIFTFFRQLKEKLDCDIRIIVTDNSVCEGNIGGGLFRDYHIVSPWEESGHPAVITGYPEENGKRSSLIIRERDVFIATYWTTMFIAKEFRGFQDQAYGTHQKLVYFIQDYEPGFYEWGSEYLLAESTYRIPDTIAVYNSENLMHYFDLLGYQFIDQMCFDPKLNDHLKEYLEGAREKGALPERKNQVIVYGRPRIWRNCFSLVVASLKEAVEREERLRKWEFLSLGAAHKDIDLGYGRKLVCRGKLTLDEYAKTMLESKAALSLMCSPHPSYPPLEMAAFGVNTVTNAFCCKDLSSFSSSITSVGISSIKEIAARLISVMDRENHLMKPDDPYLQNEDQFTEIIRRLAEDLKNREQTKK